MFYWFLVPSWWWTAASPGCLFWRWSEMISPSWPSFNQVARIREAKCLPYTYKKYCTKLLHVLSKICSSIRLGKHYVLFLPCIVIQKALMRPTVKKHVWFCWTWPFPNYLLSSMLTIICVNHAPARSFFSPFKVYWGTSFPGGPVVKNPPSIAGDRSLIPGKGTKIPHATEQLSQYVTAGEFVHPNNDPACCNYGPTTVWLQPNK